MITCPMSAIHHTDQVSGSLFLGGTFMEFARPQKVTRVILNRLIVLVLLVSGGIFRNLGAFSHHK
jgi:hypothetical protein